MKIKLFTSLFLFLLYTSSVFGQQEVYEGRESTYQNDQFYEVDWLFRFDLCQ
jgi:hypothetical protein